MFRHVEAGNGIPVGVIERVHNIASTILKNAITLQVEMKFGWIRVPTGISLRKSEIHLGYVSA